MYGNEVLRNLENPCQLVLRVTSRQAMLLQMNIKIDKESKDYKKCKNRNDKQK